MKSAIGLFLGLSTLMVSGVAKACQPSYQYLLEIDNYYQYNDQLKKNLYYKDDVFAAVVYAKKKSSKAADSSYKNHRDDGSGRLDKMRLKLIETLKGTPPKSIVVPRMSEKEIAREKKYIIEPKDMFDFWDGLQFSYASSDWYGMESMCSPIGDLTLKNKQSYLVIGYGSKVHFAEPVTGEDDILAKAVKALFNRDETSPLKISSKSFFKEMHGFRHVRTKYCPDFEYDFREVAMMWGEPEIPSADIMFESLSEHGFKIELETANFLETEKCHSGDQYLIIERPYKYYSRDRGSALDMPKHRFLKITNGKINVDDIPTNYEFTDEKIIPVEQVKAWIREGREAAGKLEK